MIPKTANAFIPSVVPAYRFLGEGGSAVTALLGIPSEVAETAIINGLPVADTRFARYLNAVINRVAIDDEDVVFALHDAEVDAHYT